MRTWPLLAIALLAAMAPSGFSNTVSEEEQRSRLQKLRTANSKTLSPTVIERAYLDTYSLLNDGNQCGVFFGGRGARFVLDELVVSLREKPITDARIGIRMSGTFRNLIVPDDGTSYRLFERVELNILGSFYKAKTFPAEPFVPHMGSFPPNTRGASVIILLHELAHLIKGTDGRWLIPDDGISPEVSRLNTQKIESTCGKQIRAL